MPPINKEELMHYCDYTPFTAIRWEHFVDATIYQILIKEDKSGVHEKELILSKERFDNLLECLCHK